MRWLLIILSFAFLQDEVPLMSSDEFSYEIEYFLKKKVRESPAVYDLKGQSRTTSDMLPFVRINFTFPSFRENDRRIRIYQGDRLLETRKIKGPMKLNLDMGFSEDLKEGVLPPVFEIFIVDRDKIRRTRIRVEVKSNGELLINNVVSGMI